jgi:hypothetical protein
MEERLNDATTLPEHEAARGAESGVMTFDPAGSHNVYLDVPACFIVFNDDPSLPDDPILDEDLTPIVVPPGGPFASMAWSSDCEWYFVVQPDSILLLHVDGDGWRCTRRSAGFIRLFVEAPKPRRRS